MGIDAWSTPKWSARLAPRFFIIVFSLLCLSFCSFLGVAKYSTSPAFCNSCHIMEPYYNAWKESKHSHVSCVECHYSPGEPEILMWKKFQALSQIVKYVTRTYSSKPYAEIEDASCLRSGCHSTRLLKGRVISEKGVFFDHAEHIMKEKKGRELKCTTCHSQIVVGRHVEVTYDSCYLCHFKNYSIGRDLQTLGGCLGCHLLPEQSFVIDKITYNHKEIVEKRGVSCENCHIDVVQGDGLAPHDRCFTCHNQPEKLAQTKDVTFLHENHVTKHNVACFHCHQEIRHGFSNRRNGKSEMVGSSASTGNTITDNKKKEKGEEYIPSVTCKNCHQGKHEGQLAIYTGKVGHLGMEEIPSPMYSAHVDCVGCHDNETIDNNGVFNGTTYVTSDKSCEKCHGQEFNGIWEATKVELKKTLDKLNEKIDAAQDLLKKSSLSQEELQEIVEKMDKAVLWYNFLKTSQGEHNIYLASWIIRQEDAILSEIGKKLNAKLPNMSRLPLVSGNYCSTLCHTKVGGQAMPDKVNFFGKEMSHSTHAVMISCVQCHNIKGHKDVQLKKDVQKSVCVMCHGL